MCVLDQSMLCRLCIHTCFREDFAASAMSLKLLESLAEKKKCAEEIIIRISSYKKKWNIDGLDKLENCILRELKFFNKLTPDKLKGTHINSSNLNHYGPLVDHIRERKGVVAVMKSYSVKVEYADVQKNIVVDIVCDNGSTWVKVIARNPLAIALVSQGNSKFGRRSIFDQAQDFLTAANQHKHMYRAPKVVFYFAAGIEPFLSYTLLHLGVSVCGSPVDLPSSRLHKICTSDSSSDEEGGDSEIGAMLEAIAIDLDCSATVTVNLDVSTMIGYVSALTNGSHNVTFELDILNQQLESEIARPLKPMLDFLFEGKSLICCESAANAFVHILFTSGGKGEQKRAEKLMNRVKIVVDTQRPITLTMNNKITKHSAIVFMTGDEHEAITASANLGFVRSALNQNVTYTVFIHESRSLSETQEKPLNGEANKDGAKGDPDGKSDEGGAKGDVDGESDEGGAEGGLDGVADEGGAKGDVDGESDEGGAEGVLDGEADEGGAKGDVNGEADEGGAKGDLQGEIDVGGAEGGLDEDFLHGDATEDPIECTCGGKAKGNRKKKVRKNRGHKQNAYTVNEYKTNWGSAN